MSGLIPFYEAQQKLYANPNRNVDQELKLARSMDPFINEICNEFSLDKKIQPPLPDNNSPLLSFEGRGIYLKENAGLPAPSDKYYSLSAEKIGQVVVRFQLNLPISTQIAAAEKILREKQKWFIKNNLLNKDEVKVLSRRKSVKNLRKYLRILDADAVQAKDREIASVLALEEDNETSIFNSTGTVIQSEIPRLLDSLKKSRDAAIEHRNEKFKYLSLVRNR